MPSTQHRLQVTPNRRFLQYEDGTPFFYLGNTAWELFHRLTLAEADCALTNRIAKGFTVIQAGAVGRTLPARPTKQSVCSLAPSQSRAKLRNSALFKTRRRLRLRSLAAA